MIRQDFNRVEPKRRNVLDHRKKQFADPSYKEAHYSTRLSIYAEPPTADITLEQFEQWAIDRLRVLAELEACSFRNRSPAETATYMKPMLEKYLPLDTNSSLSTQLSSQRKKDHYSHFILRLAFSSTEDLRRRFSRLETMLFRLRLSTDDIRERASFIQSLNLDWEMVSDGEKSQLASELAAASSMSHSGRKQQVAEEETWCKLTARALPRLDEDDRLTPILNHLSKNFVTPDAAYANDDNALSGAEINARSIDGLATAHFPLCMQNLHRSLRRDAHLKHFGRLQYTLFLKGIGLNLEECLLFWRQSFNKVTDDTFNKEYRYNVRHSYGDVGGDTNRRGGGYSPYSCQKILTEHPPGPGENHGCPYRHFNVENLTALLQAVGVTDRAVLQGVKEDKEKQKFHMACNR
ncbi:DNA primase subunit pri2 [Sporothrix bragantina]|uniref:DNA primase subunit pri2 n=1 Tax=Sporothrix bragantina TaxID=671064 RepID=A0ABP0CL01_9PEZI